MQILPADRVLHRAPARAARAFTASDLATPSINVAYGSYYLRYLLDHYDGNEMLARRRLQRRPDERRQLGRAARARRARS